MFKWLAFALIAGGVTAMPGEAATLILPDQPMYSAPVEQDSASTPFGAMPGERPRGTLGNLFGVANGEASLSSGTLAAFGAGMNAPGQFVVVYDPSPQFVLPRSVSSFLTNAEGKSRLGNYLASMASVPEPASWGFLILGMGAIGAALRRSRAKGSEINYI